MSQELTPISNSVQAVPFLDTGLEDIAPIRPSLLRFLQPSATDLFGGTPGQFYDESTGELYNELIVVPLRVTQPRVMYVPGAPFGTPPLCRSDDGKVPSPYVKTPQSALCLNCQYSEWVDSKPSECSITLKLLCILKETGIPRYVTASGTSVSPMRAMLRKINEHIQVQNLKGNPVRLYDYFFTIGSVAQRSYRVMTFKDVKRVQELGEFGPLYERFARIVHRDDVVDIDVDAAVAEEVTL